MAAHYLRLCANATIAGFCLVLISPTVMAFSISDFHWLWGIPAVLVTALDLYFLFKSTLKTPLNMDSRISTFLISVSAALTFSFAAFAMNFPPLHLPYIDMMQRIGQATALLPYPFIVAALFSLRNCLTVIPEAHCVIAHGIYKYSRHPLYMCYLVWNFAYILMFPSWLMIAINIAGMATQLLRLKREEALLLATFPEYRDYYLKTGLLGRFRGEFFLGKPLVVPVS